MTTVFRAIGWKAAQMEGGYKSYRGHVVNRLEELPQRFAFTVICGATGSAKTRVLQAIGRLGEQILDLEGLASHKGSVLGVLPGAPQPSQKGFETQLCQALASFDPARPVYVEAESRKIGNLHLPRALIECIRHGECVELNASLPARVAFLLQDYDYFLARPEFLQERIGVLHGLQSNETLARWCRLVHDSAWPTLVRELLEQHYDPLYRRSQDRNFAGYRQPLPLACDDLSADGIAQLAARIVQSRTAQTA